MKTSPLNKKALLAVLIGLFGSTGLYAQFYTPVIVSGTSPGDFEFRSDGTLISKGSYGTGTLQSSDQGAGTRMLWSPALGAFRAGYVSGTQWNLSNIGPYSTAFGYNSISNGYITTAIGNSSANGYCTTAMGNSSASGQVTTAMGSSSANGQNNTAMGYSTATGNMFSTAMGGSIANAASATAMGNSNAFGTASTAMGGMTVANGMGSTSMGLYTIAGSYGSTAVGIYNTGTGGNPTSWVSTDPLFEVGNGQSSTAKSDAFIVYKNGNATFQGTLTASGAGLTNLPAGSLSGALPTTVTVSAALITSGTLPSTVTVSGTIPASQVSGLSAFVNVSGTSTLAGSLIVTGSSVVSTSGTTIVANPNQAVLIPQQGDLSMGQFTVGQQP